LGVDVPTRTSLRSMVASKVSGVALICSLVSAHSALRVNTTGACQPPRAARRCGWSVSAEAKTCAGSPFSMRSRSRPEAPKVSATF